MKVCFTQEEVEAIVLAHVQKFFPDANTASISHYSTHYCAVTQEPVEPVVEIVKEAA